MQKICGKCGLIKDKSEFAFKNVKLQKLQSYCRICKKAYRRKTFKEYDNWRYALVSASVSTG